MGDDRQAIEFHEQALAIFREIGDREGEALALTYLAGAHSDDGTWSRAIDCAQQALRIADEIGSTQARSEGRVFLARAYLGAGALEEARTTAEEARDYDHAPTSDNVALVPAIALLRQVEHGGQSCVPRCGRGRRSAPRPYR